MNCRVCNAPSQSSFGSGIILNRSIKYFDCLVCGYVQTEEPFWLNEAYASSINPSDTGIMARNLSNVSIVLATLALIGKTSEVVVDYAGGYGFLVRLLRDKGVDAMWSDLYSENLVARGFEYSGVEQASLVTAFEVLEHFILPTNEMEKLLSISPNILFTTNLVARPTPHPSEWWYYGLEHGQHVGFYRVETLRYLADKFNLNLLTDGHSTHFFSSKKYSHAVWIALRRIAKWIPYPFTKGLASKTWSDHLDVSKS